MIRIALTPALVKELLDAGYKQNEIAAETGYSRQYISKYIHRHGLRKKTPRELALEHYPWETGERFHESVFNRAMRHHAEYYATGGEGMQEWKLKRLSTFYRHLINENLVVEFDPDIPGLDPEEIRTGQWGDSVGGFAFRRRRSSDGELIIRVNRHTRLTKQGELIWRMPPELP